MVKGDGKKMISMSDNLTSDEREYVLVLLGAQKREFIKELSTSPAESRVDEIVNAITRINSIIAKLNASNTKEFGIR